MDAPTVKTTFSSEDPISIIEVGCGTGIFTSELLRHYGLVLPPELRIVTTDFSAALVEHIRKHKASQIAARDLS